MGYHRRHITKGKYGEISKIVEELQELQDAEEQGNRIMTLIEVSDLVGAIQGYLSFRFPAFTIEDAIKMSNATRSAFMDGSRQ